MIYATSRSQTNKASQTMDIDAKRVKKTKTLDTTTDSGSFGKYGR